MEFTDERLLDAISTDLQRGRAGRVGESIQKLLNRGMAPVDILTQGLIVGMDAVGRRFHDNEIFVPEVLTAARAMICGMNIIRPHLVCDKFYPVGRVIIGTVEGDIHDIGKNMVGMMMESKRIQVIDLGTDVSPMRFVQAARQYNCQVVCCSALLTTTMHSMEEVVKAFQESGLRDSVKIMIGGAPVTEGFCRNIGADFYTADAAEAANVAYRLLKDDDRKL